jgi:hypothetical protein
MTLTTPRIARATLWLAWLPLLAPGCQQQPTSTLTADLAASQPVREAEVVVEDLLVQDQSYIAESGPVVVPRGGAVALRGKLKPGTWGLTGMVSVWKGTPDEVSGGPSIKPGDRELMLAARLYTKTGSAVELVSDELVETRHLAKDREFRGSMPIPDAAGDYALDLIIYDKTAENESADGKPVVLTLTRIPIHVE